MTLHNLLVDAELHENKGASTAADNTVATVTSGVTVWKKIASANLDTSSLFNINKFYTTLSFVDVSTPEKVYFYVPFAGTLTKVSTILQNAITVADSIVTVKNNAGSSAGTLTISFTGSAAGDIDTLIPSVNNTFTAGQFLSIETDGASTTAARLFITLSFTITG